jgi:hypothetical protein
VKSRLFSEIKLFTKNTPISQHNLFIYILLPIFIKEFHHIVWLRTSRISINSFLCFNSDKLKTSFQHMLPNHFKTENNYHIIRKWITEFNILKRPIYSIIFKLFLQARMFNGMPYETQSKIHLVDLAGRYIIMILINWKHVWLNILYIYIYCTIEVSYIKHVYLCLYYQICCRWS